MTHPSEFFSAWSPNFPAYVTNLSRLGVWGDNLALQALTEIYQVTVSVYTSARASPVRLTVVQGHGVAKLLFERSHYDSLVETSVEPGDWRGLRAGTPGVIEERALDCAAREDEALQASIAMSRETFNNSQVAVMEMLSVDDAIAEAETRASALGREVMAHEVVAQSSVDAAIAASIREATSGEEGDLNAAVAASLAGVYADWGDTEDEDALLGHAIASSLET